MNSNSSKDPNIILDEHLHEDTRLWLNTLPRNVEPKALAAQFPRLANDIANLWLDATACGKFIDSLLFGTRNGTRDGFPYEVAFELLTFREVKSCR